MYNFLKFLSEQVIKRPKVITFGRMSPPTIGHGKVIDFVKKLALEKKAAHEIIMSRKQDRKDNPLSPEQKLKHAKRLFPDTNLSVAEKNSPSVLHHASKAFNAGHDALTLVVGEDRQEAFTKLLNQYNGRHGKHGFYKFKEINVVSAGHRDPNAQGVEGMSASKMRNFVRTNNFEEFKKGLPKHINDADAKELFDDVKNGMD